MSAGDAGRYDYRAWARQQCLALCARALADGSASSAQDAFEQACVDDSVSGLLSGGLITAGGPIPEAGAMACALGCEPGLAEAYSALYGRDPASDGPVEGWRAVDSRLRCMAASEARDEVMGELAALRAGVA